MTAARDLTQLCCSSNWAGIVANKIEQSFYSVYSYSGVESIEHALSRSIIVSMVLCSIIPLNCRGQRVGLPFQVNKQGY